MATKAFTAPEKRPISVVDLATAIKHGHSLAVPDHCSTKTLCTICKAHHVRLPKTGMMAAFQNMKVIRGN